MSTALQEEIQQTLEQKGGEIPFSDFMQLALYSPGHGYYSSSAPKFGAPGDFVTAPEISPLFAQCLAKQCAEVFSEMTHPALVEFGAGSGCLMAELLLALEAMDQCPEQVSILELSQSLHQHQRQTLMDKVPHLLDRITWLQRLPEPGFVGVVIANEVVDAMPVELVRKDKQTFHRGVVRNQEDGFELAFVPMTNPRLLDACQQCLPSDLPEPYTTEINLPCKPWIHSISDFMQQGLVLVIDYGFVRREYYHPERSMGTLMCHYRHQGHADPFVFIGEQDITAHVDFTALAEAASDAGLEVAGFTTQAMALLNLGITDNLPSDELSQAYFTAANEVKQLTHPAEMGELFKVMALTRSLTKPLRAFAAYDLRSRL